jgi:hypothetical protein
VSLIDEALKRLQAGGQEGPQSAVERPWVPTPMPDAGLARRRVLVRWVGIATAAAVAAAIAAFLVLRHETAVARDGRSAPVVAPSPGPVREAEAPESPVAPAAAAPAAPVAENSGVSRTTVPPAVREAVSEKSDGPVERAVEVRPPAEVRRPRPIADGETFVGAVPLPEGQRIELGGIVYSETDPRALLNDRIVAVGAYVEGFTVSRIESDRVALEKDGLTIHLVLK